MSAHLEHTHSTMALQSPMQAEWQLFHIVQELEIIYTKLTWLEFVE